MASTPRSSSPLNPFRNGVEVEVEVDADPYAYRSSSPPLSSPTPAHHHHPSFSSFPPLPLPPTSTSSSTTSLPSFPLASSSTPKRPVLSQRYVRPAHRRSSSTVPGPTSRPTAPLTGPSSTGALGLGDDLFAGGTTPTEGAMWREKFVRRMEDRARRRRAKESDLANRRGMGGANGRSSASPGLHGEEENEDEAERQAQADDEEIFRRLVVLQRRKAYHSALYSYEFETGGSDPDLPSFWGDEGETDFDALEQEERELMRHLDNDEHVVDDDFDFDMDGIHSHFDSTGGAAEMDDEWAREAQEAEEAEEAEREAEEVEAAARAEMAYFEQMRAHGLEPQSPSMDSDSMDMD